MKATIGESLLAESDRGLWADDLISNRNRAEANQPNKDQPEMIIFSFRFVFGSLFRTDSAQLSIHRDNHRQRSQTGFLRSRFTRQQTEKETHFRHHFHRTHSHNYLQKTIKQMLSAISAAKRELKKRRNALPLDLEEPLSLAASQIMFKSVRRQ